MAAVDAAGAQLPTPRAHSQKLPSSYLSPSAVPRTSFRIASSGSNSFGASSSAASSFSGPPPPSAPSSSLPATATATTAPPPTLPTPLTPTSPLPTAFSPLPPSSIAAASPSTLRAALTQAQALIAHLRTSSAHQRLVHSLLLLDSSELRARHQVEADISSAQISVLRSSSSSRSSSSTNNGNNNNNGRALPSALATADLEACRRRLRRARRKLAQYASENTELRQRLARVTGAGAEGAGAGGRAGPASGEGEGLKALGLLASRVLESETPKRKLGSPLAFKGVGGSKRRRRSRDSTISLEDSEATAAVAAAAAEENGSPSPRKRVKPLVAAGLGLLGTPVSPHPTTAATAATRGTQRK